VLFDNRLTTRRASNVLGAGGSVGLLWWTGASWGVFPEVSLLVPLTEARYAAGAGGGDFGYRYTRVMAQLALGVVSR
ncbi:MAG: hypothetical protein AAB426_10035, partial [Myxococcota bacterium]